LAFAFPLPLSSCFGGGGTSITSTTIGSSAADSTSKAGTALRLSLTAGSVRFGCGGWSCG
jgi:hypothetical protein